MRNIADRLAQRVRADRQLEADCREKPADLWDPELRSQAPLDPADLGGRQTRGRCDVAKAQPAIQACGVQLSTEFGHCRTRAGRTTIDGRLTPRHATIFAAGTYR